MNPSYANKKGVRYRYYVSQAVRSTIITSQLPVDKWHDVIGDPTYADAILDRLVHNAHRIDLIGDSLRRTRSKQTKDCPKAVVDATNPSACEAPRLGDITSEPWAASNRNARATSAESVSYQGADRASQPHGVARQTHFYGCGDEERDYPTRDGEGSGQGRQGQVD
jgi:hypothetical protein